MRKAQGRDSQSQRGKLNRQAASPRRNSKPDIAQCLARKIGSFDISILPHDDCCTLFVPKHPETKGLPQKAKGMEDKMDLELLLEKAATNAELIEL